ncbi:MAG: beta-ketoacyl synthase [Xanthomonadales bacterium]|nr:beta-ketoacyl synthase [Xanthomonadales bacterium]
MRLPVITGFGGINPAGRLSFHHGYKRLVIDAISALEQDRTFRSLAGLMGVDNPDDPKTRRYIRDNTLIRRIDLFDPGKVFIQSAARLKSTQDGEPLTFVMNKRQLPRSIPPGWQLDSIDDNTVRVSVSGELDALFPDFRVSRVSSAGQLPKGFNPGELYQSRNHPRGLQLAVYGASDALRSTGISIERLKEVVPPDQMAVYSSSAMGQLDSEGYGALFQNPMCGKRPSSKNVPLGLSEMPGDFVNAYVLGSAGGTGGMIGACATYLYNVRHGIEEIKSGRKRLVIVGNSEAPVVPEVIEGYRTMGALAEDEQLMALDGSHVADYRRACRPFSSNTGFTVAESAVYTVIMDDELALELGARILGSVGGVYVNADGYKKSIPGPGIGNYLTMGKAMGMARAILGEKGLREHTQMFAHGTGTQQNRITESHVLNEMAKNFGIERWPVSAIKAYVGHSLAPAGGDQLAAVMGTWEYGVMPGITTVDHIADDVHHSNLNFSLSHLQIDPKNLQGAFINSKGFGGNNATGFFMSPKLTEKMLTQRWGENHMTSWRRRNEAVSATAADYDERADGGDFPPIYQLGEAVVESADLYIRPGEIRIPGFGKSVDLNLVNPYSDMTGKRDKG